MDQATGLIYMQQRYYDPAVGRFLSIDPVKASPVDGGNFNRYWYADNNPFKFTDPDGRKSLIDSPGVQQSAVQVIGTVPATEEQKNLVAMHSADHPSADAAARRFGVDTQEKANNESKEPQAGIVKISAGNYGYTKPMWGEADSTLVNVSQYTRALVAVYGTRAVALAHGHFDNNMLFSVDDLANVNVTTYMHNQNGETRKLTAAILRGEIQRGGFRSLSHMLNVKRGVQGECIGGCE